MTFHSIDMAYETEKPAPRAIVSFLRAEERPQRVRRIREALGLSQHRFTMALRVLERHGMVSRIVATPTSGPPGPGQHIYISLAPQGPPSASQPVAAAAD